MGCGLGEASTSSTKREWSEGTQEWRAFVRVVEDDAVPVFKRTGWSCYLRYQVQYSGYKLTVTTNFS